MHKNINDKLAAYEICKQIKFQLYTLSNKFIVTSLVFFQFVYKPSVLRIYLFFPFAVLIFVLNAQVYKKGRMALNNDGRQETRLVQNLINILLLNE